MTITATNEKTGTIKQVTRPMTVVERTDKDLPKRLRKKIKAIEAGEQWEEKPRRSQGRWGPTDDKEASFPEGLSVFILVKFAWYLWLLVLGSFKPSFVLVLVDAEVFRLYTTLDFYPGELPI